MRVIRAISIAAAAASLMWVGCASVQPGSLRPEWKINADVDWTGKSRYRFGAEKQAASADLEAVWVKQRELVRSLVREEMAAKGYTEDPESADWVVQFYVGTEPRGTMHYYRSTETKGQVDIHISTGESDPWIWHGWATRTVGEYIDADEEIRKAVPLILSKLPPAS